MNSKVALSWGLACLSATSKATQNANYISSHSKNKQMADVV